jgi:transposase-like protein
MGLTMVELIDRLDTEADAYQFLEELRWPTAEPDCPHCGHVGATFIVPANGLSRRTTSGTMSERRVWRCRSCRQQFSVLTGSALHGTKIPVRTWVFVIFEMCASKNGISAREIERKYGLGCPRSAWFMLHRIREAMATDAVVDAMRGVIVADETFIGGLAKNRHERDRPGHGGHSTNTPVLSLVNRATGEIRSRVIPDVTGATLRQAIEAHVELLGSELHTDAWRGYRQVGARFDTHAYVDHSAGEYARGGVSTNVVENYFSQLKRSLDGTHHHVSAQHLGRYLAEFDFRYSTTTTSDGHRMRTLLGRVGGRRLTYKRVAA